MPTYPRSWCATPDIEYFVKYFDPSIGLSKTSTTIQNMEQEHKNNQEVKSPTWVEKIENELRSEMKRRLTDFTEIKDFSPGKWEEDESSVTSPLSFGQKAVAHSGTGIPDKGDMDMYRIKASIAELIDIIDLRVPMSRPGTEEGFLERMAKDEATKKLIDACRTAVEYIKMIQDNKI